MFSQVSIVQCQTTMFKCTDSLTRSSWKSTYLLQMKRHIDINVEHGMSFTALTSGVMVTQPPHISFDFKNQG